MADPPPVSVPKLVERLRRGEPVDENLLLPGTTDRVVPPRVGTQRAARGEGRVVENPTVDLEYLRTHPAPTVYALKAQYLLDPKKSGPGAANGVYVCEVLGVAGTPSDKYMADQLLSRSPKGTLLLGFHRKKTRTPRGRTRVSRGKISAPGTGKTKLFRPRIGAEYVLEPVKASDEPRRVRIVRFNDEGKYMLAQPI